MNNKQRYVLMAVITTVTLALLFPPFVFSPGNGARIGAGYWFVFSPPHAGNQNLVGIIEVSVLLAEWIAIGIVGGIAWLLMSEQKK